MTKKTYHFITGLPRAGTTLLGTILNQNPRFSASISGPLARFVRAIITESSTQGGYRFECPPEMRKKLIASMFDTYNDTGHEVYFNQNRGWPLLQPALKNLYPNSKMLMCVREVGWVLDSFERLHRANPFSFSNMFTPDENATVYTRCQTLLHPSKTLGFAYSCVKEGITGEHKRDIMIIEYDNLARNPEMVMRSVYNFIGEPWFNHNFNDVESTHEEFDNDVGLPGLHTTRKRVQFIPRETVVPPDIWNMVNDQFPSVWR